MKKNFGCISKSDVEKCKEGRENHYCHYGLFGNSNLHYILTPLLVRGKNRKLKIFPNSYIHDIAIRNFFFCPRQRYWLATKKGT